MATLLLTAVGTALGGPIGGAIGALAGRQIDSQIIGLGRRDGPRLKELNVSTSSYGQPIAQHYGTMRAPGTVIWATDLKEQHETSGGGKGKPKTTTFSYSVSFAVALSSRPIDGIGRIWADGNLLRGSAGDLKTGGALRIYNGWGDQPPDPLLSSAEGVSCPAFRGTAYLVFEDLQLADFGNRIPALSFEVFAGDGSETIKGLLASLDGAIAEPADTSSQITGYSWEGGTLGQALETIDSLVPLTLNAAGIALNVERQADGSNSSAAELPPAAVAWEEGDFGTFDGHRRRREVAEKERPEVLRYYDPARDFQPGTQRALGQTANALARTIEFPGALASATARNLIDQAAHHSLERREVLSWRVAEVDPALQPGAIVSAPGIAGTWRVAAWEWRERGVEYELVRTSGLATPAYSGDPGRAWLSPDLEVTQTLLRVFELPLENSGQAGIPSVFAATMSDSAGWPGASLFAEVAGELIPLETSSRTRANGGMLTAPLAGSQSVRLDCNSTLDIAFHSDDAALQSASLTALAFGANRLLVGDEILQFADAQKIGPANWRLTGLLRGRGGSESVAALGHTAGTPVTVLDDRLIALDDGAVAGAARLAAIGPADTVPAYAAIENHGRTRKPVTPVHPRSDTMSDGSLCLSWTRRARGAWTWIDEVDVPLVEEAERYRVGIGPIAAPIVQWESTEPSLVIDLSQLTSLQAGHPGELIWVRQIGSHALSDPLLLGSIS